MSDRRHLTGGRKGVVLLGLAALYFAAGKLGLSLAFANASASPVWPPTGIALAAFLLLGPQAWPAVLAGAFLVNYSTAGSGAVCLMIALGNVAEGLVGARLLERFAGGTGCFDRASDVFKFALLAAGIATALSATIGVSALTLGGLARRADWASVWLTWWLGDAGGALAVAPPLILWGRDATLRLGRKNVAEGIAFAAVLAAAALLAFGGAPYGLRGHTIAFLPLLVWAGFRFDARGSATALLALASIAVWATLHGRGPFAGSDSNESLLLVTSFVAVSCVTTLALSALVARLRRDEEALRSARDVFERLLAERTASLSRAVEALREEARQRERSEETRRRLAAIVESSDDAIIGASVDGTFTSWNAGAERMFGYSATEALGRPATMLAVPGGEDEIQRNIAAASMGSRLAFEARRRRKDGTLIDVSLTVSPTRGPGGAIDGYSAIYRDITKRKAAERALYESERRYRAVVETAPDVIFSLSADGRLLSANPAFEQALGWPAADWVGEDWTPLLHPDDVAPSRAACRRALEGRRPGPPIELRLRTKPEGWAVLETTLAPLRFGGEPSLLGVARNVTVRKRIESELRQAQELYHRIVEGVVDYAIIALDVEGRVQTWNRGAERIQGYGAIEIIGRPFSIFYAETDRARGVPQALLETARRDGRAESSGWRLRKNGERYWAHTVLTTLRGEDGSVRGFVKVTRDLTEMRKVEELSSRLIALIESSPDAILGLALDGTIESWNPEAARTYGWEASEARGRNIRFLAAPEAPDPVPEALESCSRGERPVPFETSWRAKDGRDVVVSISLSPVRDPSGRVIGAAAIARDVTQLKRVERLRSEVENRRRLDKLKDKLLSVVSHELRTPIAIVQGALFNLAEGLAGPLSAGQSRMVDMAHSNAQRLARMINNLLDLSRLESGKTIVNRRPIDLGRVLRDTIEEMTTSGNGRPGIELDLPPALPEVSADPDMLVQVLSNLLDNALRFARSSVTVRAREEAGSVEVLVIDDGPGIPAESLKELFTKFYQVDRPVGGSGYKGTGLGLAICKEIVSLHGGRIWVESAAGQGARFHFTLPFRPAEVAARGGR